MRLYLKKVRQRSFSSRRVHKNMPRFYNKDIKILVALLLELKMFEFVCLYNFRDHGHSHQELFYKKCFVKIIVKLTREQLCWNLILKKTDQKREKKCSSAGVFTWVLPNLSEHSFWRMPAGSCYDDKVPWKSKTMASAFQIYFAIILKLMIWWNSIVILQTFDLGFFSVYIGML